VRSKVEQENLMLADLREFGVLRQELRKWVGELNFADGHPAGENPAGENFGNRADLPHNRL